jgi:hypothetical protein
VAQRVSAKVLEPVVALAVAAIEAPGPCTTHALQVLVNLVDADAALGSARVQEYLCGNVHACTVLRQYLEACGRPRTARRADWYPEDALALLCSIMHVNPAAQAALHTTHAMLQPVLCLVGRMTNRSTACRNDRRAVALCALRLMVWGHAAAQQAAVELGAVDALRGVVGESPYFEPEYNQLQALLILQRLAKGRTAAVATPDLVGDLKVVVSGGGGHAGHQDWSKKVKANARALLAAVAPGDAGKRGVKRAHE